MTPQEKRRKERNQELCWAVKNGYHIPSLMPLEALAFPPRPIIKKNEKELKRVYGK